MEVGCQLQTPSTLHTVKQPLIPTEQETGLAPDSVWTFWRRQKSLTFAGNQTTDHPAHSWVTVTTTLSQHPILQSCPTTYHVYNPLRSPVFHDKMHIFCLPTRATYSDHLKQVTCSNMMWVDISHGIPSHSLSLFLS